MLVQIDRDWVYTPDEKGVYTPTMSETSKELALRPQCDTCGEFYELRTARTVEQAWCGTWYDHPPVGLRCHSRGSVLLPSPELIASHAA